MTQAHTQLLKSKVGTQIITKRENHTITRNASFFKDFVKPDSDPIIPSLKPSTHINPPLQVSPSMNLNELPEDDSSQEDPAQDRNEDTKQHRTRRRPQYLEDYVCDSDSLNEAGGEM
ncbi:hypothetical protein QE152_g8716 [Popillia japonica]|uniref:Uncharacterized protein n=1 Tax=Popillia japonica TaxID=7064 RepID=A0AAW1M2N1_POPJA